MDQYLAMILMWGGNYAPRGFALCNGQIVAISQNTALFSLIGTYYGGNGTSNFALPDLRGRAAVSQGSGPGLTTYFIGETTGNYQESLTSSNIPMHNHLVNGYSATGSSNSPAGTLPGEGPKKGVGPGAKGLDYYNSAAPNITLNPLAVSTNVGGGSNPVQIMQPYLAVSHIIALVGIYPARS